MVVKGRTMDVIAWSSNVIFSICIIFVTKTLMGSPYNFSFATFICGLHFIACALFIRTLSFFGFIEHVPIPFKFILLFSAIGSVSIASANLSLLLNTVGFYQISKLLLAPFVCLIESLYFGKRFSMPVLLSILVTLIGVGVITVSNVDTHPLGVLMSLVFIVSSGLQQILCGHFQAKFSLQSHQLLANTAPLQGLILLSLGPFIDEMVTGEWISSWEPNVPALQILGVSCLIAVGTNLSQFLCLGRFTATSFQVLGHAKTLLVLFGGWFFFHEQATYKQLGGMALAVAGMISYGYFMSQGGVKSQASPQKDAPTNQKL